MVRSFLFNKFFVRIEGKGYLKSKLYLQLFSSYQFSRIEVIINDFSVLFAADIFPRKLYY